VHAFPVAAWSIRTSISEKPPVMPLWMTKTRVAWTRGPISERNRSQQKHHRENTALDFGRTSPLAEIKW